MRARLENCEIDRLLQTRVSITAGPGSTLKKRPTELWSGQDRNAHQRDEQQMRPAHVRVKLTPKQEEMARWHVHTPPVERSR